MKLLVVEDDRVAALYLRRSLERLGHDVTVVTNGTFALDALSTNEFRIVISDWMMPEMDGLTLCHLIRSRENSPYVYFIMQTAKADTPSLEEAMRVGCDDFFVKPIDVGDIIARLAIAERILKMKDELCTSTNRIAEMHAQLEKHGTQLADLLIASGILTPERMREAAQQRAETRQSLVEVFLERGWVDDSVIAKLIGDPVCA